LINLAIFIYNEKIGNYLLESKVLIY